MRIQNTVWRVLSVSESIPVDTNSIRDRLGLTPEHNIILDLRSALYLPTDDLITVIDEHARRAAKFGTGVSVVVTEEGMDAFMKNRRAKRFALFATIDEAIAAE